MRIANCLIAQKFCQTSPKVVTLKSDESKKLSTIIMSNPKKRNTLSLQAITLLKDSLKQVEAEIVAKKTKVIVY